MSFTNAQSISFKFRTHSMEDYGNGKKFSFIEKEGQLLWPVQSSLSWGYVSIITSVNLSPSLDSTFLPSKDPEYSPSVTAK